MAEQYFGTTEAAAWVDGQSYTVHIDQLFPTDAVPAKVVAELVKRGLLATEPQGSDRIETATRRPGRRSTARRPR